MSWTTQPVDMLDERPWIALVHIDEKGPEVAAYINRDKWGILMDSYEEVEKLWEQSISL